MSVKSHLSHSRSGSVERVKEHEMRLPEYEGGRSAKLAYSVREKLPDDAFAIPTSRAYPVPTVDELRKAGAPNPEKSGPRHAINALARVAQHGNESEQRKVCDLVRRRYPSVHSKSCPMHSSGRFKKVQVGEYHVRAHVSHSKSGRPERVAAHEVKAHEATYNA